MIRIEVERLGDGRVLMQVGDEWHLVLAAGDAEHVGVMLAAAAVAGPSVARIARWSHDVVDLYCATCGHVHAGPELAGICIGCDCEARA